ncbi:MAG: arginine--tRNA ligase [Bdellovibrionales bacterium]|nr:arginine--tRNA ligase [Oligoflexia bacterium]
MEKFKIDIATALSEALGNPVTASEIETPPDRTMGDFAFPCFKLSKAAKKAPPLIAGELATKVSPLISSEFLSVKQVGPYVNFSLTPKAITEILLVQMLTDRPGYASKPARSREKWVFEFSSPNVAKPFQIYHLRTTVVGSALSKIAKHRGYQVTTINHLGDWGTQYGKMAIALKRYEKDLPSELTLKDLVTAYVRIHKDMETDTTIEKAGQDAFRKLEEGNPELRALWKKCVDISMKEFDKTYARYQVKFDHTWGESHYESFLKPMLANLKERGILIEDQGAWIVRVTSRDGHEMPPCILEKSDGASIYGTRDLAAAMYRHEKLNFDRMSYVVGKEQKLHFEQLFAVLRIMGFAWEANCEHIATGLYRFKDAKMSTRKGNFITLEEVNELCLEKTLALMNERNERPEAHADSKLSETEIATIADQVTVGAIVFADLSTDPSRDMEFDVDRVISFEGETGPYLQYAHTRCLSILRKAGVDKENSPEPIASLYSSKLGKPEEFLLIRTLARFGETLERTLDQRKPSQLTTFLIELTKDFGHFYRECKVMNVNDPELTKARLALVYATQNILSLGLDLLGIPKPEKM